MKRTLLSALLLLTLVGCSQLPKPNLEIPGEVTSAMPLTRTAYISVELYGQQSGRSVSLARQSYRLGMLPLAFSFTLPPSTDVTGLALRASLSWAPEGVEQSSARAVVVPGAPTMLHLQMRPCFPRCMGSKL